MPWAACRYRPQSLLWNTRLFRFQTTCSDIILIPSISSNVQQWYPNHYYFLWLFPLHISSFDGKMLKAAPATAAPEPFPKAQIPQVGNKPPRFIIIYLQTRKREGDDLPRATKNFRDRAQSTGQLSQHQDSLGTWVGYFWAGSASTSEANCKFTRGISILQTMINCLPSRH